MKDPRRRDWQLKSHLLSWCFISAETIRLITDGESRWEKKEVIYLSLYGHNQNDSRIKMGSYERLFYVSLTVRDKVARQCPQTTTFLKRRDSRSGIEPRPRQWGHRHCEATSVLRNCGFNCCAKQSQVRSTVVEEQLKQKTAHLSEPSSTSLLLVSPRLS